MELKYAIGSLTLALVTASAGAVTVIPQGGSAGVIDNTSVLLGGMHSTTEALNGFIDTFEFLVTGSGTAAAQFFESDVTNKGIVFHFSALLVTDATNTPIASDFDGSDGWSVQAILPGAGSYRVVVGGSLDPASPEIMDGIYLGAVGTTVNAVPEPASYGLMLLGLAAIGAWRRRR